MFHVHKINNKVNGKNNISKNMQHKLHLQSLMVSVLADYRYGLFKPLLIHITFILQRNFLILKVQFIDDAH